MGILSKSTIEKWILPHLTVGERGFETTVQLFRIVECIFLLKLVVNSVDYRQKEFSVSDLRLELSLLIQQMVKSVL